MKVFRFMSLIELGLYLNENKLENNKDHSKGNKSTSKGFCFLSLGQYKPEIALHFLIGAIDRPDVCAIFEVDRKELKKHYGIYAKVVPLEENTPERTQRAIDGTIEKMKVDEFCTKSYSKQNFKLLKVAKPIFGERDTWKWIDI